MGRCARTGRRGYQALTRTLTDANLALARSYIAAKAVGAAGGHLELETAVGQLSAVEHRQ